MTSPRAWAAMAIGAAALAGPAVAAPVDHILVEKTAHRMTLYAGSTPVRTYRVAVGRGGLEPKAREGDRRTPEGDYVVDFRKSDSRYHRALHISYPTPDEARAARAAGRDPGGAIMIHGKPNGLSAAFAFGDWTDGCIAVTDSEIEEIWRLVPNGTRVRIVR